MNEGEIAERLVQAAEIERNIAVSIGPAKARSLPLPYAHDWADMNGWGKERLEEEQREFAASVSKRPTRQQVTEAEEATGWYALVSNENNRSALATWVWAMAGGRLFKDACFKAGIHPETGRRRKDRAISEIAYALARKPWQNNETGRNGVLLPPPDFGDIPDTIGVPVRNEDRIVAAATLDGLPAWDGDASADFSWADARNKRRRQREARKRKEAEKQQAKRAT